MARQRSFCRMFLVVASVLTLCKLFTAIIAFASWTSRPRAKKRLLVGTVVFTRHTFHSRSKLLQQPWDLQTISHQHAFRDSNIAQTVSARSGARLFSSTASAFISLALGSQLAVRRWQRRHGRCATAATEGRVVPVQSTAQKFSSVFCNLFPVWLAIAAVSALKQPVLFAWVKASYLPGLLGALMFSVGITTTIDEFKSSLLRPGAVAINFISCYAIMPALAFAIAKLNGFDADILAGLIFVGSISSGQASNLCTLIAGGDVALSVLMTTSTTLGCILMTPSICELVLGVVVPVDARVIVISTFEVVLAPTFLGVGLNMLAPKFCKAVAPIMPVIGVIVTVLIVGDSVAKHAELLIGAGVPLQLACLGLHLFGGLLGYLATAVCGHDKRICRTVAIETTMKSSAFGFLLTSLLNVRAAETMAAAATATKAATAIKAAVVTNAATATLAPSALSVVWMAITGSALAVYWKGKPPATA